MDFADKKIKVYRKRIRQLSRLDAKSFTTLLVLKNMKGVKLIAKGLKAFLVSSIKQISNKRIPYITFLKIKFALRKQKNYYILKKDWSVWIDDNIDSVLKLL